MNITYRIILVIGDNHKEIARKYSADLKDNPNAYYKYERCQQHRLEVTGEEGDFSDPFPLKDGMSISYSAHYNEIDWNKIHRNPQQVNLSKRVWELVMENDEPKDINEKNLKKRFYERTSYFTNNFESKEQYVDYSSNLWYWGIATDEKYVEVDYKKDDKDTDMDWCVNFFDRFIKPLEKTNPLITIYETHSI